MKFNSTQYNNDECFSFYGFFSFLSLFLTSFSIAFSIVGSTIYTRVGDYDNFLDDDDQEDAAEDEKEEVEYDHLYYDELDKLEDRVLEKEDLEKLEKVIVREKTPNGEVIMTYNHNTESFCYYCDDKNIKYMVLDAVARKFTIDNNCKSICVNYKAEFEKAKVAIMADQVTTTASTSSTTTDESETTTTTPPPVVKRSIYAKFKNYNTTKKEEKTATATSSLSKTDKIYILTDKANRFTYKGRLSNYKDPASIEVTNTVYKKTIDFATFKQTMCNKSD
jgi:hypothetical protein